MIPRRVRGPAGAVLALVIALLLPFTPGAPTAAESLPVRLTDQEFWKLVSDLSEPSGSFRSDNLLSNEVRLQYTMPQLLERITPGGAYLGVGPEQNFTLIAAVKPSMAFIIDVRRGNLQLHLLYKALFELSADRVEFVSRLFSRARPAGLRGRATAVEIFTACVMAEPSEALYASNLKELASHLTVRHGFALSADDLKGIEYAYNAFFTYGPSIQYSSSDGFTSGAEPSYVELMLATDATGRQRSYLASEDAFAFVKDLEMRNVVVPVVGDFAGPKAIRGVGKYLKERDAVVSAFYVSNVEQYLRLFRVWAALCSNAQALPADESSTLIRAGRGGRVARGNTLMAEVVRLTSEVQVCGPGR